MDVSSCVDPVDEFGNSFTCSFPIQDQADFDDLAEAEQRKLFSLPSPLNLVSAIKGGREKNGVLPRKLTVSWASDVYDPIPTISSHTVNRGSRKNQKPKSSKKNWKNEKKSHKGSSSRASSGKDKRRSRKVSGTSRPIYDLEPLTKLSDEFDSLTMYGSDSPPWFGTSILRKSFADMCYPVAEAL